MDSAVPSDRHTRSWYIAEDQLAQSRPSDSYALQGEGGDGRRGEGRIGEGGRGGEGRIGERG